MATILQQQLNAAPGSNTVADFQESENPSFSGISVNLCALQIPGNFRTRKIYAWLTLNGSSNVYFVIQCSVEFWLSSTRVGILPLVICQETFSFADSQRLVKTTGSPFTNYFTGGTAASYLGGNSPVITQAPTSSPDDLVIGVAGAQPGKGLPQITVLHPVTLTGSFDTVIASCQKIVFPSGISSARIYLACLSTN